MAGGAHQDPKKASRAKRPSSPGGPGSSADGTTEPRGRAAADGAGDAKDPSALEKTPGLEEVANVPAGKDFKALPPPSKDLSRDELAKQYMPYVRSIAGKIKKTLSKDIEFDDLVSYGMLGLFEAADRFDAKYGANFMTFAYYRVRGAIYDGLRGMGWVSRTEYQRYRFEQNANQYLSNTHEQGLQVPPGIKKSDEEEVEDLAGVVEGLVTIYVTALDAMEGFQIKDDRGPSVDESLELQQARALVAEAVAKLPDQEKKLLQLYYYKELSLEDVGKELGLSKSWTSRLHTRAINKLGRLLKDLVAEYQEGGGEGTGKAAGGRSAQPTGPPGR